MNKINTAADRRFYRVLSRDFSCPNRKFPPTCPTTQKRNSVKYIKSFCDRQQKASFFF